MEFSHIPVMPDECIEGLDIKTDGIYVDGTEVGILQMKTYAYVNGNFLGTGTEDSGESKEPSNVCFRRPDDVIAVTGPLSKISNIAVTFDPSLLYRTVTKGYASKQTAYTSTGRSEEPATQG